MAKKKDEGLLGPDGRALSQALGGFGTQIRRYSDWRKAREARIRGQNKPTKPKPTPTRRGISNIPASEGSRNNPNYGRPGNPNSANKPKPKPKPTPKPTPTNTPKPTPTNTPKPTPRKPTPSKPTPRAASASDGQNLTQGRSPDKPARKSRTWLADNYKPGGPPKSESLKIKPKKQRLTNKQRKQGGFH